MIAWRSGSSSIAQRPISSMVRLQPRQRPLLRSSVQMPMQGDITRRTGSGVGPSPIVWSGLLAEFRELALQLVELALEIVDRRLVAGRRCVLLGWFLAVGCGRWARPGAERVEHAHGLLEHCHVLLAHRLELLERIEAERILQVAPH